ncbi:head-tail adaptor protein [Shimwellia blattae]|uniref:Phage head-tail adaptor n=1 Tax=Shimwellia blattae (strain ATCC 29907 / DSM 4481 / JCM 1650 / NBRC 105725 / CDC 9005-74) TaxID=630626 RepID=I2B9E2_SHIBC|nr:head-tail adaptor protein [Shimwellia blattae]AFJ47146.1 hypothetical protein EBL_c20550 [Shimwellia blattae DSM 4481 = NBRC 105725]GAB80734.1 hypothetical protein EB105725_08_00190 [Shimwellia blattae DSM 4481 = NBRC 105725]VDY64638.1 Bacteriophage head-tail adaptor [Shimwellia blattae]VEC22745.1 Bacteriophage head-tail adaptor [Shimwellia blattae]
MSVLHAGELNKRITLQCPRTVRGKLGEVIPDQLIDIATVWAMAEVKSNRKIRTFDQQQVVETWLFTLRPRPDIRIGWQIRWQELLFTVVAVDRTRPDRIEIKAERDTRHDRTGH